MVVYLHHSKLGTSWLSMTSGRDASGFFELWRTFGVRFTDDLAPCGERDDVLAWATARRLDVRDGEAAT